MTEHEIIEKLKDKTYVRAFGLMSQEEQEVYRKVGNDNCLLFGAFGWLTFSSDFVYHNTYAIKPDYQPELKLRFEDLTEDNLWNLTIKMFEDYIEEQTKEDITVYKIKWLKRRGFEEIFNSCLFCHEVKKNEGKGSIDVSGLCCPTCPIVKVEPDAHCATPEYHYRNKTDKFLEKLKEWNRIRLASKIKKPEPEYMNVEVILSCTTLGVKIDGNGWYPIYSLPSLSNFGGFYLKSGLEISTEDIARKHKEGKTVIARFRKQQ